MYTLTIVLPLSRLVLESDFATKEACEANAEDARAFKAAPRAVESAHCDPKSTPHSSRGGGAATRWTVVG